ncbi:hypothetical protein [Geodermatophilus sp. SYSU D00684]
MLSGGMVTATPVWLVRRSRTLWSLVVRRAGRSTDERALSRYYSTYRRSGRTSPAFVLRHPLASLLALVAITGLPSRTASLSATPAGVALYEALRRPALFRAPLGMTGVSVLSIPEDPRGYLHEPGRQTLRRKWRAARRSGLVCRSITDPAERRSLLEVADQAERSHPNPLYRNDRPDNAELFEYDLWMGTFSATGEPLLLSVTPTDGEWALLRYFRTLGRGRQYSDSRYLATVALVEALHQRGVRHLADTWHPGEIPEGLRLFQRWVGYRIQRVTARIGPSGTTS